LGSAKTFNGYRWATANDEAARDPKVFTLHTSSDGTDYTLRSEVTDTVTDTRLTYVGPYTNFYYPKNSISPGWTEDTIEAAHGVLPKGNDSLIDGSLAEWSNFQTFLNKGVKAGETFSSETVSTYSLVYTGGNDVYTGGVLAPNGDIHFVPRNANRGQKISATGVVSTYSLIYTITDAYYGGVLAPNGDIHFIPNSARVGQKINASGVVSTYSLAYTTIDAYAGGVVAPNGDIHFIPRSAALGQKIVPGLLGGVYTYTLVYTTTFAYFGGVLAPNGDIHFVPRNADRGQKISASGFVSTYTLPNDGTLELSLRGHGYSQVAAEGNLTLNYNTVRSGSAPVAGDLVVWCVRAADDGGDPMNTISGWTQQRAYTGSALGSSVLAKVVTASDISSPATVASSIQYGGTGMWIAYQVTSGRVSNLGIGGYSAKYGGTSGVSSTVVDSTSIPDDEYAITVAFGAGTNATIDLSAAGMGSDIQFQLTPGSPGGSVNVEFIANTSLGGVSTTLSMPDEGNGNATLGAYVQVSYGQGLYKGGVLSPNGDIHFIPANAAVGLKINPSGVASTYSLVYTLNWAYLGGVLAPNGDIHFIPANAAVGQKISAAGVVSTYSLVYTAGDAYSGGVLAPNGDIHFIPRRANRGQKVHTNSARPFGIGVASSPWLNKL
jgi:hypothetical protein